MVQQSLPAMPASTILGDTSDILSHIFSYLPSSSLFATLQVSKSFFHASVPHLYNTVTIKPGSRNIFLGSTRSDNLTFDKKPVANQTDATNDITKNSLLKHIKRVNVYVHSINECPFVKQFIQPLPNLELVHLAKGRGGYTDNLDDGSNLCYNEKCQFITKVCTNTQKVIIRDLDFTPLKFFKKLESVIVKLRPCELPFYTGEGLVRRSYFINNDSDDPNQDNDTNHNDNNSNSQRETEIIGQLDKNNLADLWYRKSSNLPNSIEKLNLIFWDESHKYRLIESYETAPNHNHHWFGGRSDGVRTIKGCNYCDQLGCVRYSPHVGIQLPILFWLLGKKNKSIHKISIWNFEKTAENYQWRDYELLYEDLIDEINKSFYEGKKDRIKSGSHSTISNGDEPTNNNRIYSDNTEMKVENVDEEIIQFRSGLEYFNLNENDNNEIDEEELCYWKDRFSPSGKLRELRRRVQEEVSSTRRIMTGLDTWSEDDCLNYLIQRYNEQRLAEEENARLKIRHEVEAIQEEEEEEEE
ncbi:uncharacterized protein L201_000076 [Kwoniella dendrophila CBS 6074]|uniref:F-box domain-containing protein n=1 Tax=Kwoniella dendrophila CBS 6074 TaxID=1295534 RepID=A0AAX4JIB4_9TREE